MTLNRLPYLSGRHEHLRMTEFRDTATPRREQANDAGLLSELSMGSALLVAFRIRNKPAGLLGLAFGLPRASFDVNLQLLLKLLGSSLAAGLERVRLSLSLERLEARTELGELAANDGLWDFDVEAQETYFSPRWRTMLGYDTVELQRNFDWRTLVHAEDSVRVQNAIRDHVAGKTPMFESVHRMQHRSGEWRWVSSRGQGDGRSARAPAAPGGRRTRRHRAQALRRSAVPREGERADHAAVHRRWRHHDRCRLGHRLHQSGRRGADRLAAGRCHGQPVEEIFRAFHEETCEPLENPLTVAIRRSARHQVGAADAADPPRRQRTVRREHGGADPRRRRRIAGGVLVFHDVSESRELNRRLSYHASHDLLTGLVNRREFENRLERALKSAKARETSYALCYLDIDQFKIVNDTCGHSAGDALLGQVGALLKSKVRWRDTLARLGGDEFGILLESCSLDEAMRTAEALREAVRNFRFTWEDRVFRLGASIGVVPIAADNEDVASILSAADSACQAAKEGGRNRVHSFAENDIELMRRRREMQWAARINAALEEGRFELFRMTILPLQKPVTGAHYELLLRMRDEGAHRLAGQFHRRGRALRHHAAIDRWVIENAFRWLVSEADEREKLAMCSINLSGQSLGDDKFLPFVIDQFHKSGLDASKICFEITETAAVASFSQANRFIQALKELGCKFALDDFGTGLSSFGYLKHFPVDFLKIDGSFVREILHDPIDREMVRSINEIGHLTGKQTIAEFAENAEIIQMLTSLGIDYAQGYGIAQPQRRDRVQAVEIEHLRDELPRGRAIDLRETCADVERSPLLARQPAPGPARARSARSARVRRAHHRRRAAR